MVPLVHGVGKRNVVAKLDSCSWQLCVPPPFEGGDSMVLHASRTYKHMGTCLSNGVRLRSLVGWVP